MLLKELAPKVTFVPVNGLIEAQRVIKDPSEMEKIREAVRVAERAFRMFTATLRETDTEKDMVDALECYVRRSGARGTSFPPIVAVGERGALPHAPPTDKQLGDGSKVLIDWGADLLYKSDLTRTLRSPFGTSPTRRNKYERVGLNFEEVYQIVLDAQNAALAAIRPGVKAKDVDAAARKVIASAKLKIKSRHQTRRLLHARTGARDRAGVPRGPAGAGELGGRARVRHGHHHRAGRLHSRAGAASGSRTTCSSPTTAYSCSRALLARTGLVRRAEASHGQGRQFRASSIGAVLACQDSRNSCIRLA